MSERPLLADFEPHFGTSFSLEAEAEGLGFEVVLISGKELLSGPAAHLPDVSFSLVFRGPLDLKLPQTTCTLSHSDMGAQDLFLVPVHEDEEGRYYEATFNYVD